jgi:hypothetical protein
MNYRTLTLAVLIVLLTPSLIAVAQSPELVTYDGILKVGKYESTINYLGNESGDLAVFCFRNKSAAGRAILSKCRHGELCRFTGYLRWSDCHPVGPVSATGRIVSIKSVARPACSQPAAERNKLVDEAQRNEFTLRRVEFIGLTYTPYHLPRGRMTINEGDVFTRAKLVRNLRRMSGLRRAIYPIRLADVIIQLDRSYGLVDMTICFRQRPRR